MCYNSKVVGIRQTFVKKLGSFNLVDHVSPEVQNCNKENRTCNERKVSLCTYFVFDERISDKEKGDEFDG